MAMSKIKRDDEVIVITGKDRGKTGKVQRLLGDGRAIVTGIQMVKKHVRPNPQAGEQGGVVEREAPIQLSNLSLMHPETGKPDRVGFAVGEDGKRYRIFKSDSAPVDQPSGGKGRKG